MQTNSQTNNMQTLSECINKLVIDGYDVDFKIDEKGKLYSPRKEKSYPPEKVHIRNFFRFEGASDPDESAILYAIETDNGEKGTLTDAYGPYADAKVTKFIQMVEDISKKNPNPVPKTDPVEH
jgi:hypothetical protein